MKRQRTPNFNSQEREILIKLIEKHKEIIENKKTDGTTAQEKNKTWAAITDQFNTVTPNHKHRSEDSLKVYYKNLKKVIRKKASEKHKDTYLTGGGPKPVPFSDDDNKILSIINTKTVFGLNNFFDCDEMPQQHRKNHIGDNEDTFDDMDATEIVYNNDLKKDWKYFKMSDLQSSLNEALMSNIDTQPASNNLSSFQSPNTLKNLEAYFSKENLDSDEVNLSATRNLTTDTPRTKPKSSYRRRPQTGVRALTSSDVAEKYNVLLERRLVLVNNQIEQINEDQNFAREEHKQKIILLKQQTEIAALEKEEKKMKVELLKLEVVSKKSILGNI